MEEDYVSFEIAKLLKEKGFDDNCAALYDLRTGKLGQRGVGYVFNNGQWVYFITAPTLQMAMKWLREVHKLDIVIRPYITTEGVMYCYEIKKLHTDMVEGLKNHAGYECHEQAAAAAIKYALENLI